MTLRPHGPANTRQVKNNMGTGLTKDCFVSINSGNNKQFDVSPGTLRFLDNTTDPLKPVFTEKFFPGENGIDINLTGSANTTTVAIDDTLTVFAENFTGPDTRTQNRNRVQIAIVFHIGDNPIISILPLISNLNIDSQFAAVDLMKSVGRIRQTGLRISSNGANLMLDRSSGTETSPFFENFENNPEDPSTLILLSSIAFSFAPTWSDGAGGTAVGALVTNIDPSVFDDGTGGTTEPNGTVNNNNAQIIRIFELNAAFAFTYGAVVYNNISAAADSVMTEQFTATDVFGGSAFRGFLIVRGGATDLSLSTDALFFNPPTDFVSVRVG